MQQVRRITAVNQALQRSQGAAQRRAQKLAEEKAAIAAKFSELQQSLEKEHMTNGAKETTTDGGCQDGAVSYFKMDAIPMLCARALIISTVSFMPLSLKHVVMI